MKLLIDTWGWVELRDLQGPRHSQVRQFYLSFRQQKGIAYTTDYVLDETITLLFRRLHFKQANDSLSFIEKMISTGFLRLE